MAENRSREEGGLSGGAGEYGFAVTSLWLAAGFTGAEPSTGCSHGKDSWTDVGSAGGAER